MEAITIAPKFLEIEVDGNAVFADVKKAMQMIRGVVSVRVINPSMSEKPNKTTQKAIEDVKAGKTYKASSVDDLFAQCLG